MNRSRSAHTWCGCAIYWTTKDFPLLLYSFYSILSSSFISIYFISHIIHKNSLTLNYISVKLIPYFPFSIYLFYYEILLCFTSTESDCTSIILIFSVLCVVTLIQHNSTVYLSHFRNANHTLNLINLLQYWTLGKINYWYYYNVGTLKLRNILVVFYTQVVFYIHLPGIEFNISRLRSQFVFR